MIVISAKGLLITFHQNNAIKGFVFSFAEGKKRKEKQANKKKWQFAVNQLSN